MSDDPTNDQIHLLCDVEEYDHLSKLTEQKRCDLEQLLAAGYVGQAPAGFALTAKTFKFLGDRGAVLDEALPLRHLATRLF
jgi:hypothetical protein